MFKRTYSVDKIKKGKLLQYAQKASVQQFIDCRLQNRYRKAPVGIYLVFYEDRQFIYWGEPRFRMIFSNKRVVKILYKTDKQAVLEAYPEYLDDYLSEDIKQTVLEAIRQYEGEKDGIRFHHATFNRALKISIEENLFVVTAFCQIEYVSAPYMQEEGVEKKPTSVERNYKIKLNRSDLSIVCVD